HSGWPDCQKDCDPRSRLYAASAWDARDNTFFRTARRGVKPFRDAAGEIGEAAGFDSVAHRVGHAQGVFGVGDARIEEHTIDAQLHRDRDIARRADAGVNDHRIVGIVLFEVFKANADVVGIQDALAGADRATGRHHACRASFFEAAGNDWVVGRVAE